MSGLEVGDEEIIIALMAGLNVAKTYVRFTPWFMRGIICGYGTGSSLG
jgi:hypothetical protein